MKFLAIALLTLSSVVFAADPAPVRKNCQCVNCQCTPESHCGCFSEEGCHCTPDAMACGRSDCPHRK